MREWKDGITKNRFQHLAISEADVTKILSFQLMEIINMKAKTQNRNFLNPREK